MARASFLSSWELIGGTAVYMNGPDGKARFSLESTPTGHALFVMNHPHTGDPSLQIDTATPTGADRIIFHDPASNETFTIDAEVVQAMHEVAFPDAPRE